MNKIIMSEEDIVRSVFERQSYSKDTLLFWHVDFIPGNKYVSVSWLREHGVDLDEKVLNDSS